MTVNEIVTVTDTTESMIQQTQASVMAQDPQYGIHSVHQAEINVANPIGIVPRKSELVLSAIMTVHISGYRVYRRKEMMKAQANRMLFNPRKTTASQYSHSASNGMAANSRDTIPVPIVTLNHDGEKFLTILRHPTYMVSDL